MHILYYPYKYILHITCIHTWVGNIIITMGIQMRNTDVIAWLICMLICIPATHNQSIGLTLDTYTVNANAKYTFSITDGSFLTNSGTVSL